MAVGKKKAIRDFTQGNPTKELLMFSLPIACTLILQSFYNMADTLIIGNFVGDTAMGAVGTAGTVSSVLLMLVCRPEWVSLFPSLSGQKIIKM